MPWIVAQHGKRAVNSDQCCSLQVHGHMLVAFIPVAENGEETRLEQTRVTLQIYDTPEQADRALGQLLNYIGHQVPVIMPLHYDGCDIVIGEYE